MDNQDPKSPAPSNGSAALPARQTHVAWLTSEVERLDTLLRPAPPEVIDKAIRLLIEPFGIKAGTEESKVAAYLIVLEDFCETAIREAVRDFFKGRTGLSGDWPPTPPQLAVLCRERQERLGVERAQRRIEMQRERLPAPAPTSPEERAVFAAKMEAAIAELRQRAADNSLGAFAEQAARQAGVTAAAAARGERVDADLAERVAADAEHMRGGNDD